MKVLNLAYPDKSEIKFTKSSYPDGQNNIVINQPITEFYGELQNLSVQINSRLNNWLDLELIVCAVASLRNLKVKEIHLYIPYILGARSDRRFEIGGNRYIKDVIAPILNSLNFESVTCYDPHSYVLENCINNFESITNVELVRWAISDLKGSFKSPSPLPNTENIVLVSPDAGASHKIYKLAEQIGYKGDIITCSKERDTDGKLTKTVVPINKFEGKDLIIIDDIIDGGSTFINIVKELRGKLNNYTKFNTKPKIYLIVTHGIFSKGFQELYDNFNGIYCTNSYADVENCTKGKHALANGGPVVKDWVKQLNVF